MSEILEIEPDRLRTSEENWEVYARPEADDQFAALVESVTEKGVLHPLTISCDWHVLSGNRRLAAALKAGLPFVPIIIDESAVFESMSREERIQTLTQHNEGSRVKTDLELIAESAAKLDPGEAVAEIRARKSQVFNKVKTSLEPASSTDSNRRKHPLPFRAQFLYAVQEVIEDLGDRDLLPVTARRIHYRLLSKAPLTSTKKNGLPSRAGHPYGTESGDSGLLSKLLTDGRSYGLIPDEAIYDDTRAEHIVKNWANIGDYVRDEMNGLFKGYYSNIHRDQPSHVEIVVEKNTLFPTVRDRVAHPLRLPITSARGFASYPLSCKLRDRFRKSGKEKLTIVFITDHDPEGLCMPGAVLKYMEIDHGIRAEVVRGALTMEQIKSLDLPHDASVKEKSSSRDTYSSKHGDKVWELDAVDVDVLVGLIHDACCSCLDMDLLNAAFKKEDEADYKLAKLNEAMKRAVPQIAGLVLDAND